MKTNRLLLKILLFTVLGILVLFAGLYFATSGHWRVEETVAQNPRIPHVTIDGVTFHAESFGADTADVIIVIHGGPGMDYRYLLPLKELADQYRVVFYDQRGTGLSPRVEASELTLQSSLEDLHRIIQYYSPEKKVNLLGHSWGAMIASGYLGQHPEKVNKVILAEPGFLTSEMADLFMEVTNGFQVEMTFGNILFMAKTVLRGLHVREPDNQAMKDYIFSALITADIPNHPMLGYFCHSKSNPDAMLYWRMSMTASQAIQQSQTDEDGKIRLDLVHGVDQYPDTVLFIAGDCNRLIGPSFQEKQLKHFPRHRMEVIKDAGHYMFLDQPEEFFKITREYFGITSSVVQ
ncbi:MAG: alpha/beta hydrolase [Cyclobacteriaceae bacterium]|nr:alpha/beta hydrolase [Cyclobacteriaceae bacterium]